MVLREEGSIDVDANSDTAWEAGVLLANTLARNLIQGPSLVWCHMVMLNQFLDRNLP